MPDAFIHWISGSLNRKFIAGTTAGLIAFSVLFLILFLGCTEASWRKSGRTRQNR